MRHTVYLCLFFALLTHAGFSQCITNVDFNTWSQAGKLANGNWTPQGGGTSVFQSVNGEPTFFVSPFDLMNVQITGNFKTTDNDDDFMGFVFSFLNPLGQTDSFDTWLFDWKKGTQGSGGYTAQSGKSLSRVKGVIPPSAYSQTFWGHQNTPEFTVLQTDWPGAGWVTNYDHSFELTLTFTRAVIKIDGQLVFDQSDCFLPGRFGFYNYSQKNCTYSNFQYTLSADFTVVDSAVCLGNPTDFRFYDACGGSSFNLSQYQSVTWDFGDGQTQTINNPTTANVNVSHVYTQPGNYSATFTIVDALGCTASATRQVAVLNPVIADFNAPPSCESKTTAFTDASSGNPTAWAWTLGDGTTAIGSTPTHTYAADGNYTVTLIANNANGCPDTITKSVTVWPKVTAGFTVADACYEDSTHFIATATGPIAAYQWDFGNGTSSSQQQPVYRYPAAGSYTVLQTVTSADGCSDTTSKTIQVFPKPTAAFQVNAVCYTAPSVFADTSSVSSGILSTYTWNFGDGTTSGMVNPQHQYNQPGNYPVMLVVVSDQNCADTAFASAIVNPNPVTSFTTGAVCLNNPNYFTNTSVISSGSIGQFVWDFGDGQTSQSPQPSHVYASYGNFQISLIAVSDSGCTDSFSMNVTVYDKPVAAYNATEVCQGDSTWFTDQSTIASGNVVQWWYQLGDGNTSLQQHPAHTYALAGTYSTTLMVTSDNGCTDTAIQSVTVNPLPQVTIASPNVCFGEASMFSNSTTIALGSVASWSWAFGDGNTASVQQPTHTYSSPGSYTVQLQAISDQGCEDSAAITLSVYELPEVSTTSAPACFETANGSAEAVITNGTAPYSYLWSNGSTTSQLQNLYAGNYQLTVTDAHACTASANETVSQPAQALTVSADPSPATLEIGNILPMTVTNSYQDADAVYTITPAYGLSCYSCAQFDAFPYTTTTYTVQVTDHLGCIGSGTFTIEVNEALPVFVPNAFTPNGDGQNDTWGVFSRGVKYIQLQVFNRLGEKVFETENMNQFWDGTYQQQPAVPGVYVYQTKIVFLNNETRALKGTVTLLR